MSDENNGTLAYLNKRIQELEGQLADHKNRARTRAKDVERLTAENAKLLKDLESAAAASSKHDEVIKQLKAEMDSLPNKHKAENEQLRKDILTRDRKDAFKKAADGKIKKDALDDAFNFLPWDEVQDLDEVKLGEMVDGLITQKAYLKASEDADSAAGGTGHPVRGGSASPSFANRAPGPGFGRGSAPAAASTEITSLTGSASRIA